MSTPPRRPDEAGRLKVWVVILAVAFVAVALQQSHRYERLRASSSHDDGPMDVRTAYRNSLHAFDFYCEKAEAPEVGCATARAFLRAMARRQCEPARARLGELLGEPPSEAATRHPLGPPFLAFHRTVCGEDSTGSPTTSGP